MTENSSRKAAGFNSTYLYSIPAKNLKIPLKTDRVLPISGDRKTGTQYSPKTNGYLRHRNRPFWYHVLHVLWWRRWHSRPDFLQKTEYCWSQVWNSLQSCRSHKFGKKRKHKTTYQETVSHRGKTHVPLSQGKKEAAKQSEDDLYKADLKKKKIKKLCSSGIVQDQWRVSWPWSSCVTWSSLCPGLPSSDPVKSAENTLLDCQQLPKLDNQSNILLETPRVKGLHGAITKRCCIQLRKRLCIQTLARASLRLRLSKSH